MFRRLKVDVVFYYPQHFNRSEGLENAYFSDMINTCMQHNISFLVFEEPDFKTNFKRSKKSIPFDFLFLLIQVFRRCFFWQKNPIKKDQIIGRLFKKVLFERLRFKNVITISQSMVSFFRGFSPACNIYDVQHGIIHNNKANYIKNNKVEDNLTKNDVHLLLSGQSFQDILIRHDKSSYFRSHSSVIGYGNDKPRKLYERFNHNALVTLQFTADHDEKTNKLLHQQLVDFISSNKNVNFYLKHHPRFNKELDLTTLFKLNNVHLASVNIRECFQQCSLNITAYSTSVFEAAFFGIPSILINPLSRFNFFKDDFNYPLQYTINDFRDIRVYQESSQLLMDWAINFYTSYDENKFLNLLK
ncbi:MAG: hypothetical protein CBC83_00515 [Flavobacteriales bacterium TMED123]|nr:MAG: hypothetical protein CBC83_00515 [Flavobacteriales bacterium TMED123]